MMMGALKVQSGCREIAGHFNLRCCLLHVTDFRKRKANFHRGFLLKGKRTALAVEENARPVAAVNHLSWHLRAAYLPPLVEVFLPQCARTS
jgi:hypothetical protein